MIGIAGPSCSGKTALAKYLMKKLGQDNCSVIQLDSYYHDLSHLTPRETDKHNYDHPGALEKNLLIEHIRSIADGNNVYVPVYDYVTHTRTQDNRLQKPMKFILVVKEGGVSGLIYVRRTMMIYYVKRFICWLQKDLDARTKLMLKNRIFLWKITRINLWFYELLIIYE